MFANIFIFKDDFDQKVKNYKTKKHYPYKIKRVV